MLQDLEAAPNGDTITVGGIVDHFADRGIAAILGLLALPIALPVPMPGISAIFGLPMLIIASQLILQRKRLWLPDSLRRRAIDLGRFRKGSVVAVKWLAKLERLLKPRLVILCHPIMQILYGVICAWLALILFLPIPFGNVLPSLSVFVLALAILERDGVAAIMGLILATVSIVVTAGATIAGLYGAWHFAQRLLGA
jgi:hypothetical protein